MLDFGLLGKLVCSLGPMIAPAHGAARHRMSLLAQLDDANLGRRVMRSQMIGGFCMKQIRRLMIVGIQTLELGIRMTCRTTIRRDVSWDQEQDGERRESTDTLLAARVQLAGQEALHILEALTTAGIEVTGFCRELAIDRAALSHPACWIGGDAIDALFQRVADQTADELISLHLAEQTSLHGFLYYLAVAQPTVRRFLDRLITYQGLAFDRRVVEGHSNGAGYFLALTAELDDGSSLGAYWLATVGLAVAQVTDPTVRPVEVSLADRRSSVVEYERVFGCRVRLGQERCGILFPLTMLDQPLTTANAAVADRLEDAGTVLIQAALAGTFRERVRAVIRSLQMSDRPCEREAAAYALGVSARTLQRRLDAEGVTFRAVLDEVRREVALTLLGDTSVLISDIASRCGFSDEAAFNRAFHRWTGTAPRTYRSNSKRPRG